MCCSMFRLLVAILAFVVGVGTTSLMSVNRLSSLPNSLPPITEDMPPITEENHVVSVLAKPKTVTDDRDLSLYDFGGRQGCGIVRLSEVSRCKSSIRNARAFIWKHWQEKKRGYVIVKMASVDAESDSHIFIEPNENGIWHIVWKWERIFAVSMAEDISGRIDQIPEIRFVERKRATNEDYEYEPGTSYLLFLGKDGEVIQSL